MLYNTNRKMTDTGGRISRIKKPEETEQKPASTAVGIVTGALPVKQYTQQPAYTGYGSGSAAAAPETPSIARPEDAESEYERLLKEAQGMAKAPVYTDEYDDRINALYAQITGRRNFNYDLNADALWQQYQDSYTQMGKQAMRDSMGRAAALTGGYGSSYGQAVGQQQYDQYLQELGDVVPELYESAYQKWADEGDRLFQQYGILTDRQAQDYARYQDEYNKWLTERSYADAKAEDALSRQSDNLNMLQYMISIGYTPTAQEIADAGLTPDQYVAMMQYKQAQEAAAAAGGGGGGYSVPAPGAEDETPTAVQREYSADGKFVKNANGSWVNASGMTQSGYGPATYERLGYNLRNMRDTERADVIAEGVANGYIDEETANKYVKQYGLEALFG